jgi:hypothetical protein
LLIDIGRDISIQMTGMQKDRVLLDDADVELQYLQGEVENFKERQKRQREEEERR